MKKGWIISFALLYVAICFTAAMVANRTKQMAEEQAEYETRFAYSERDHAFALAEQYKKQYQESLFEIADLKAENERLAAENEELTRAFEETSFALDEVCDATGWTQLGTFRITHYCNCQLCCGKWSGGPTSSGTIPVVGRTVAVDPKVIPIGSKVRINGHEYVAEDTGVSGNAIDIFVNDHQEALRLGLYYAEVEIKEVV